LLGFPSLTQCDPDIITGYNVVNFDLPYLLDRAKVGLFPLLCCIAAALLVVLLILTTLSRCGLVWLFVDRLSKLTAFHIWVASKPARAA